MIMTTGLKYAEITEKIIGCGMTVHRKMGSGYSELIYSRCLAIEFDKVGLKYKKELEWPVYYDEIIVANRMPKAAVAESPGSTLHLVIVVCGLLEILAKHARQQVSRDIPEIEPHGITTKIFDDRLLIHLLSFASALREGQKSSNAEVLRRISLLLHPRTALLQK